MKKESRFFKWIYAPLIAPAILLILGAVVTGKIVIQITGFQLSIGLTVIIILVIFAVMITSFLLGIGYLIFLGASFILKVKMPLPYRIATHLIINPFNWFLERFTLTEEDKKDLADSRSALENYQKRVASELERIHNEPPASATK